MKAVVRNQVALARKSQGPETAQGAQQSPEHSASATSGTYFRAVRPTDAEVTALARGQAVICAKVERLCSSIEAGMWHADYDVVAQCMIDDAECESDD